MRPRVVVLGAGFGGLELTTIISEAFGDTIDIVLIDKGDAFVFGLSKLEVMFGRQIVRAASQTVFRDKPQHNRVSSPQDPDFPSNPHINNYLAQEDSCRLVKVNPI
jgi:NADH dehydrogenase FAD-containing subunit